MVGGWMGSVCVCACRSIGTQPDPLYPTSPTDIHSTNPRICIRIHLHTHILHTHTHTHTQHTPPSTNNNLTPWQSSTTQVIAGLYMSFYGRGRISARVRAELNSFWAMLGYVANSLIFFVAGLQMIMRGACVSLLKWGPVCLSPCPFPLSLIPSPPPTPHTHRRSGLGLYPQGGLGLLRGHLPPRQRPPLRRRLLLLPRAPTVRPAILPCVTGDDQIEIKHTNTPA